MSDADKILKKYYKDVMDTAAGKAVIWDILSNCDIYGNHMVPDENMTAFYLGRKSVGTELLSQLEIVDPKFYPKLIIENINNG